MSRYNHFSDKKYKEISFNSLSIGDKFRKDFHIKNRRRRDIVCIKTGILSFVEYRSGEYGVFVDSSALVSSYKEKI